MVSTEEIVHNSDESDVQYAVDQTGFGKFTIKVAILGGLIYMNTGLCIGSVGFILPSAACDLQLTTLDKGRISATPILGMVFGSYFWGGFADVRGRRSALLYALFSYAIIEIVTSLATAYWMFLLLKFFSGWAINGQGTLVFTYLGEFQSNEWREKVLCWMEMAWTVGIIILPPIAWLVIPLEFAYVTEGFSFRSWNLFIIVCALPSIIIGCWLFYFPDTPKFLAENNQDQKFVRALETMYTENTGCTFDKYLDNLQKNGQDKLRRRLALAKMTKARKPRSTDTDNLSDTSTTKGNLLLDVLQSIVTQTIKLWQPPHRYRTFLLCSLMYCFGSSYYAIMLWFPELFQRFAEFENARPGESASVCKISLYNQVVTKDSNDTMLVCSKSIENHVYLHTLILGLACLPVSIILPLFVRKLGYKFYMIISALAASIVTVGFFFVTSSTENLVLSCIFEAFSSVCMSIIFCLVVDLFPTNLRALAAAHCGLFGRLGALVGNSLFGYLIDDYCVPLIAIVAGQLIRERLLPQSSSDGSLSPMPIRHRTSRSQTRRRSRAHSQTQRRSQTRRSTTRSRSRRSQSRSRSTEVFSEDALARGSSHQRYSRSPVPKNVEGPTSEVEAQRTKGDVNTETTPFAGTPADVFTREDATVSKQAGEPSPEIPEHEIELQQEVLEVIGSRLESETITGAAIHRDIALRWSEIVKKGLPTDEVKTLLEKYPAPENCNCIVVPKLNTEITAAVQETALKRDKRIVEKQERIAACLAALGKAITIALKIEGPEKIELLEKLSDGSRLLASIHREESLARKGLILANLNSSLKTTLSNTSVDEWLFGIDLDEKLKVAKNLEKTLNELKPPAKPVQQSIAQKNIKNSKGPSRQSLYRNRSTMSGGRRQYNNNRNREHYSSNQNNNSDSKKTLDRRGSSRNYRKRR